MLNQYDQLKDAQRRVLIHAHNDYVHDLDSAQLQLFCDCVFLTHLEPDHHASM